MLRHAKEPGILLVHGSIDPGGSGNRHDHAWAELAGNITFDGATGEFYATDAYGPAVGAVVTHRFTAADAARLLLRTGHHGPWTATELMAAGVKPEDPRRSS